METIRFIVPSIILLISVIYLILTFNLPESRVGNPTAAMNYPLLIGFSLLGLSILYIFSEIKDKKKIFTAYKVFADKELTIKVIVVLVFCLGYTILFERIGFLFSTIIFLGALLFLINGRRKWIMNITVAVLFSFISWYTFAELLSVSLP